MVGNITNHENTRTISRTSHSVNSVEQIVYHFIHSQFTEHNFMQELK